MADPSIDPVAYWTAVGVTGVLWTVRASLPDDLCDAAALLALLILLDLPFRYAHRPGRSPLNRSAPRI